MCHKESSIPTAQTKPPLMDLLLSRLQTHKSLYSPRSPPRPPLPLLHSMDSNSSLLAFTSMPLLTQSLSLNNLPSHVQQANSHASFKKWFTPFLCPFGNFFILIIQFYPKNHFRIFYVSAAFPPWLPFLLNWISWGQKLYYILHILSPSLWGKSLPHSFSEEFGFWSQNAWVWTPVPIMYGPEQFI